MKLSQLSLSVLLFLSHFALGMDVSYKKNILHLTDSAILYIAAASANKNATSRTNKYLSQLVTRENILKEYPQYLNKKDHLHLMVKYARANDEEMMKLAIENAPVCGHYDAVQIISYFIADDFSSLDDSSFVLDILELFQQDRNPHECITALLPTIIKVYRGGKKTLETYKKKYLKDADPEDEMSALHVAAFNNHLSVAKLLLTQNRKLLNKQTFFENLTPLHIAVNNQNVPFCTFLLSFKNIKTTLFNSDIMTAPDMAATVRNSEILELFLNHEKEKLITDSITQ